MRFILAALAAIALSACGGSDNSNTSTTPPPTGTTPTTGNVKVTLSFPVATASAFATATSVVHRTKAQPRSYVSSKTQSVSLTLVSVDGASPASPAGVTVNVAAGSTCAVSGGNFNCTITLAVPIGNDQFEVSTWPGTDAQGGTALSTGTGTTNVPADGNVDLSVELLPRVAGFSVDFTPAAGSQSIGSAGTFTARIRAKDSAGDIITGATAYHDPIVITSKELGAHLTASPGLPASFTSPAQDTLTLTYDGAGTAASYGFTATSVIFTTFSLTLATTTEHIYVSVPGANQIDVYDIQADGSLTGPSRSIAGAATGLNHPGSIAVDAQGQLYVVNSNNIELFAPGATGDATPLQTTFSGASPYYVSDQGGLFLNTAPVDPGNSGASTATVSINYIPGAQSSTDGASTAVPAFVDPYAGAVASIATANGGGYLCETYVDSADSNENRIRCFTLPITTATNPSYLPSDYPNIQIINGIANNTISCCFVNAADIKFLANGTLAVSSNSKSNAPAALETYIVNPEQRLTSIQGDSTGITAPGAVAVDSNGNLYVLNEGSFSGSGAVLEFPAAATGNVAPSHTLTGLNSPGGMAIGK